MPLVVFTVMVVIQFALYQHGSHVVTAAAQDGVVAVLVERGTEREGHARSMQTIGRLGRGLLQEIGVTVVRSPESSSVTVDADVVSLVPGFRFHVRGTAEGATERFRARTEP